MARTVSEVVAEGRRLIAQATKLPWDLPHLGNPGIACRCGTIFAGPEEIVVATVHEGSRHAGAPSYNEAARNAALIPFAVNALPALLDVAEAAAAYQEEMAALGNGVDPALSAALSALGLGPDDEGKEKSNG